MSSQSTLWGIQCGTRPYYTNPEVVLANRSNAETIVKLVCAAFSKGDIFRKPDYPRLTKQEVEAHFNRKNHKWFVVLVNTRKRIGKIAAAVLYVSESETLAVTHFLTTWPKYRGCGFGKTLRNYCDSYAREEGKQRITFQVASVNTSLIEYYEKLGYSLTGEVEEYFQEALQPEWKGNVKTLRMVKDFFPTLR